MVKLSEKLISRVARLEGVPKKIIKAGLADGTIVVLKNCVRNMKAPCAVGAGTKTKVNANIGLSSGNSSVALEMNKMKEAVASGADVIMDLSTGPLISKLRKRILAECPVPVGTVPVYDLACGKKKDFTALTEDDFIAVLEKQAAEGVDFFTIHAGITLELARYASKNPRVINIVSRGGAMLSSWMMENGRENPFLSRFDEIIRIAKKYTVTLSLGDSLRPGAIQDATDHLQIQELLELGRLQQRALSAGVQVMIEGPGHMPLDQIEMNVKLQKKICHGSPFYVLGPLVTDSAPGYDHITSAIGGAIAAWHGADFLCYVTPAEHVKLPDIDDVRNGVMASRIAAHAADIVKGFPSALKRDEEMSKARAKRDWKKQFKLALDPALPGSMRKRSVPDEDDVCTMCGEFCSIKITEKGFNKKRCRKTTSKKAKKSR